MEDPVLHKQSPSLEKSFDSLDCQWSSLIGGGGGYEGKELTGEYLAYYTGSRFYESSGNTQHLIMYTVT